MCGELTDHVVCLSLDSAAQVHLMHGQTEYSLRTLGYKSIITLADVGTFSSRQTDQNNVS